jgi:methyl-accepting chemotaxis protein
MTVEEDTHLIARAAEAQAKTLAQVHEDLKQLIAVIQALNESVKSVAGTLAAGNAGRR